MQSRLVLHSIVISRYHPLSCLKFSSRNMLAVKIMASRSREINLWAFFSVIYCANIFPDAHYLRLAWMMMRKYQSLFSCLNRIEFFESELCFCGYVHMFLSLCLHFITIFRLSFFFARIQKCKFSADAAFTCNCDDWKKNRLNLFMHKFLNIHLVNAKSEWKFFLRGFNYMII